MVTLTNETWSSTIDDVEYIFFRTAVPLGMKLFYGFEKDFCGGANKSGGGFAFAAEFDTLPEQADVENLLPL